MEIKILHCIHQPEYHTQHIDSEELLWRAQIQGDHKCVYIYIYAHTWI